jgi:hypothetical protein
MHVKTDKKQKIGKKGEKRGKCTGKRKITGEGKEV